MNTPVSGAILIGQQADQLVLKPTGPATAAVSDAFRTFIQLQQKPHITDIYIDLRDTDRIDSTFTGMLLATLKEAARGERPALHLIEPAPKVRASLESMYVLQVFNVCGDLPFTPAGWHPLPSEGVDPQRLAELMVQAHQALIAADPRNRAEFEGVVRMFEQPTPASPDEPPSGH